MKKIIVTGGTGFIGSHTCVELLKNGYKLIVLDSLRNSSEKVVKNIITSAQLDNKVDDYSLSFFKVDLKYSKL